MQIVERRPQFQSAFASLAGGFVSTVSKRDRGAPAVDQRHENVGASATSQSTEQVVRERAPAMAG